MRDLKGAWKGRVCSEEGRVKSQLRAINGLATGQAVIENNNDSPVLASEPIFRTRSVFW